MAILQYWCPTHHTTKRLTRLDTFHDVYDSFDKKTYSTSSFISITPICQICRKKMVYAGSNLPKKKKKNKKHN